MLVLRRGTLLEFVALEFDRFLLELLAPALVFVRGCFVLKSRIVLVLDRWPHLVLIVFTVLLSILIRIVLRSVNLFVFILPAFVLPLIDLRYVVVTIRLISNLFVLARLFVQFRTRLLIGLIVFPVLIVLGMLLLVFYLMRIVLEHLIGLVPLLFVFSWKSVLEFFLNFSLFKFYLIGLFVVGRGAG